jgi:hypothetical protein
MTEYNLEGISAIRVTSISNIKMISEDETLDWDEMGITIQYIAKEEIVGIETLPLLRFKQLVKEADRQGIEIGYSEEFEAKPKDKCKSCQPPVDVIAIVREMIKEEKSMFDPGII